MSEAIQSVKDNQEKYETYRNNIGKYNLAMKYGFYFEAMMIDYAMLEDRLSSFLVACGIMFAPDNFSLGSKANRGILREVIAKITGNEKAPALRNISGKIEMIRILLQFAESDYAGDRKYLKLLHEGLQVIDRAAVADALDGVDTWRGFRNEIVHAAMQKNVYSIKDEIEEQARNGMQYARIIDNAAKTMKRRKRIRQSVKMPV